MVLAVFCVTLWQFAAELFCWTLFLFYPICWFIIVLNRSWLALTASCWERSSWLLRLSVCHGPGVIKLFHISTQLSMKFSLFMMLTFSYLFAEKISRSAMFSKKEFTVFRNLRLLAEHVYCSAELSMKKSLITTGHGLFAFFVSLVGYKLWSSILQSIRYLEDQETVWNSSRYPYLDMSYLQNRGKSKSNNQILHMNMWYDSWN